MEPLTIAFLLSSGSSLVGSFMANGNQKEANRINKEIAQANLELQKLDLEERKKVNAFMQKLALAPTTSATGDVTQFIEDKGFVTTAGEDTTRQLNSDKSNQLLNNLVNVPRQQFNADESFRIGNEQNRIANESLKSLTNINNVVNPKVRQAKSRIAGGNQLNNILDVLQNNLTSQASRSGQDVSLLLSNLAQQRAKTLQNSFTDSQEQVGNQTRQVNNQTSSSDLQKILALNQAGNKNITQPQNNVSNLANILSQRGGIPKNIIPQFAGAFNSPNSPQQGFVAPDNTNANFIRDIGGSVSDLIALLSQRASKIGGANLFDRPFSTEKSGKDLLNFDKSDFDFNFNSN